MESRSWVAARYVRDCTEIGGTLQDNCCHLRLTDNVSCSISLAGPEQMREAENGDLSEHSPRPESREDDHYENGEASTVRSSAVFRSFYGGHRWFCFLITSVSLAQSGQHAEEEDEEQWNTNWAIIELVHNTTSFGKDKETLNSASSISKPPSDVRSRLPYERRPVPCPERAQSRCLCIRHGGVFRPSPSVSGALIAIYFVRRR